MVTELPTLTDRPNADVVIFDGNCAFCRGQLNNLRKFDTSGRLAYVSLHDAAVQERYPDLTHDQLMKEMYVIDRQGRRHAGGAAIRYLTRRLPLLWWLAPLLHLPGSLPIWRFLYHQVAKRRYKLSAQDCEGACEIHL